MKKAKLRQLRKYLQSIIPDEKKKIDTSKSIKELITEKNDKTKTKRKTKSK